MSRPLYQFNRPRDLDPEIKQKIQDIFPVNVRIDWNSEVLNVIRHDHVTTIPMEVIGKMLGVMQQKCITVRKSVKESKIRKL